jgi:hypothetical protein
LFHSCDVEGIALCMHSIGHVIKETSVAINENSHSSHRSLECINVSMVCGYMYICPTDMKSTKYLFRYSSIRMEVARDDV